MSAPQELIGGRYRLRRRIAAGGMGVVWEARDELLERPVAVKQLHTQAGVPEEEAAFAKQRAMREARITARLHHPNAVVVFDSVEHEGEPCLVMQYVPSAPLSALLREHGALSVGETARIGAQIAGALAAAHELGIVHRDVKPGNILIRDSDGDAMLSDFGISHALGDATVTSTSLVHGTPAYLAPEVARGEASSFASDVFSLGSTLYAASEGEAPFGEAPNSIAVLHRVASGGFRAPQRSGALGALLLQMMADDPDARPTMEEVAHRLAELQPAADPPEARTLPLPPAVDADTALIDTDARTAALPTPPDDAARTEAVPMEAEPETAAEEADAATGPVETAAETAGPEETAAVETEAGGTEPARTLAVPVVAAVAGTAEPAEEGAVAVTGRAEPAEEGVPAERAGASEGSRTRRGLVVGAVVVAVLLLVGGLGLVRLLQPDGGAPRASAAGSVPPATATASPASTPIPTTSSPAPTATATPTSAAPTSAAPTSAAPTPTAKPTPTPTRSPSGGSGLTAARMTAAISRYYGLVPGDLDDAWPLLTPAYQVDHAGGRAAYDRFWAPIGSVDASGVHATGADTVTATITYHYRSGRTVTEVTGFRMVSQSGVLKIAASTVASSTG